MKKDIKPIHSESFSEADINLIRIAPKLFDTLTTVNSRLEDLLSNEDIQVPSDVGDEISDIQTVIWETLNDDGNLNGTAEWVKPTKYLCGNCGHIEREGDETGEGGLCPKCNGVEKEDLSDNAKLKRVISDNFDLMKRLLQRNFYE